MVKQLIFGILLLLTAQTTKAQEFSLRSIDIFSGKQFSNFLFKNSDDSKDQSLEYQTYNSFGLNGSLTSGRHTIRPELLIREAGAKKTLENTEVRWKMDYFNFNIGYGYNLFENDRFKIQPGAALGIGYLLEGEQLIGDMRLSITEEESMKRFEFSTYGFSNFRAFLSKSISLSLEYRFGIGINQIENENNDQQTRNIYHSAILGIGIALD